MRSESFDAFYKSLDDKVQEKIDYVLSVMTELRVVNTKFVNRLEGTEFYEMRISIHNEYRVILFTIDEDNFISANNVLLLNGFLKRSTKDYKPQISLARNILKTYLK